MTSSLLTDVPPGILLLIFIAIAVGVVLVVSWLFYDRFILMSQSPPKSDEGDTEDPPKPVIPGTYDLTARLLTFTTLAFVFMLAFVLNTFWNNVQTAQSATLAAATNLARLNAFTQGIPDPASAAAVKAAIDDYVASIIEEQWPLLQVADSVAATNATIDATTALTTVIIQAREADTTSSPVWSAFESTLTDLGQDSADRLGQLPSDSAPARIWTVVILGVAMLLMTTAFLPTRVKPYRISISIMAMLTALLLFVMVQASNPYAQHVAPTSLSQALDSGG